MGYELDLDSLTLGEAADIEATLGVSPMGAALARPSVRLTLGLVWVALRRTWPDEDPLALLTLARAERVVDLTLTLTGTVADVG